MANITKLISDAKQHMESDENVVAAICGQYETKVLGSDTIRTGVFIATEHRLIFYAKKVIGYDFETFPYSNISSIELSQGIMGEAVSFFASGNKIKMKWIRNGDAKALVAHVSANIGKKQSKPVGHSSDSAVDQIEKLYALKQKGILTEGEFEMQKKKLLDG